MTIVVDTTVVIAVITNEPHKPRLIQMTQGADLRAPRSLHWEVGNAFSAMFRQRRISLDDALRAIDVMNHIAIDLVDIPLDGAVRLANDLGIYAYDAYMIHCAKMNGCPLLTLDQGLRNAAARAQVQALEVVP